MATCVLWFLTFYFVQKTYKQKGITISNQKTWIVILGLKRRMRILCSTLLPFSTYSFLLSSSGRWHCTTIEHEALWDKMFLQTKESQTEERLRRRHLLQWYTGVLPKQQSMQYTVHSDWVTCHLKALSVFTQWGVKTLRPCRVLAADTFMKSDMNKHQATATSYTRTLLCPHC